MTQAVYKELLEVMKKRGGGYAGMDIPEFYTLMEALFTPAQAEVNNAMPKGPFTAKDLAAQMGREEEEITDILVKETPAPFIPREVRATVVGQMLRFIARKMEGEP